MDTFFLVLLVFLAILAAVDLFVGVSNDAVNFLNSAVGSRIAPFKVVLGVAAVGVLLGATFSGGMMEIARSGVFHPSMFSFSDVIVIYFAVMVTDVLLLNVFNKMGLPTSTTVSIVFELLGAAAGVAINRLIQNGESALGFGAYINDSKALGMISAILVSVVVAFLAGVIVQWITRVIFTFRYDRLFKKLGGIYGGFSLAMIFYFLVMKGAKGASFMTPDVLAFLDAYGTELVLGIFVVCSILLQLGMMFFKTNVFRIIILAGTFALAFAFAGNDLVNFVGVPLAALDSYNNYLAAGSSPGMKMDCLLHAMRTPTGYLLLAGVIMTLTLWFSKKAHRVVQTTVNLSASTSQEEQFSSTLPGRAIVRGGLAAGEILQQIMPASVLSSIGNRMRKPDHLLDSEGRELPFDELRASINLVVASILIASATSLKLPLSTTYVTFMAAMGSSFADGAWDRESAVYRVSGVITVIGGWFLTALTAFTACAIVTLCIFWGGVPMSVFLMALAVFLLVRSNFIRKQNEETSYAIVTAKTDDPKALSLQLNKDADESIAGIIAIANDGLKGLLNEDAKVLAETKKKAAAFFDRTDAQRNEYYRLAVSGSRENEKADAAHIFHYRVFNNLRIVARNLQTVCDGAYDQVINNHRAFTGVLRRNLQDMVSGLSRFRSMAKDRSGNMDAFREYVNTVSAEITHYQMELLRQISPMRLSQRSSDFYLAMLAFGRDALNRFSMVMYLEQELAGRYSAKPEKKAADAGGTPEPAV